MEQELRDREMKDVTGGTDSNAFPWDHYKLYCPNCSFWEARTYVNGKPDPAAVANAQQRHDKNPLGCKATLLIKHNVLA